MRTLQNNTAPLLIASALLVAGFVCASAVAIGLRELLDIGSIWPFDLMLLGALLGTISWRAGRRVLEFVDDTPRHAVPKHPFGDRSSAYRKNLSFRADSGAKPLAHL